MFDHLKYLDNSSSFYLFAKQRTSNGKLRDWSNTYVNLQVVNGARIELEVSEQVISDRYWDEEDHPIQNILTR